MLMLDRAQKKEIIRDLVDAKRLFEATSCPLPSELNLVLQVLTVVDKICQQNLSIPRYKFYGDLLHTLIETVTNLSVLNEYSKNEAVKLILDILEYCVDALEKEKVKKEIVFLPYKASMWDCMETVWRAAYEDREHCNVYVIPIPYCDRNSDLSCGEIYCEKDLFPDYVNALDWAKYDLKKIKPDIVLIHNPYDDTNLVTSVEERFYSRNIKKYTKKLIYIPYYISNDIVGALKCTAPGVLNADQVILENENIKRQYEVYYPKTIIPKDKFLALGSPKIEKVLSTTLEDIDMPEAWKKLLADRKVILYNTSIGAILDKNVDVCGKLKFVFNRFRNDNRLVLWWRPHPLIKSTLKTIRPNIYEEYCRIEREYRDAGWGIYDDTPDMDRAIICGDCYYGDDSGVMWTYKATGKSIVEQSMSYVSEKQDFDIPVWAQAFCKVDDELWLVHGKLNILLKYNIGEDKLYYVDSLAGSLFGMYKYCSLQYVGGKIYFIPIMADKIICYDIATQKFSHISFPMDQQYAGMAKFRKALTVKEKIYVFPTFYPYILCVNTVNNTVEYSFDVKKILAENNIPQSSYIHDVAVYDRNILMCLLYKSNKILLLDIETKNCEIITLGKHEYSTIAIIYNSIFLASAVDSCIDCFSKRDLAYRNTIVDRLCVVRKFDEHHVLLDNVNEPGWAVMDSECKLIYKNDVQVESDGCLMDVYKRVICDMQGNIWDTCTNTLYLWKYGKSVQLNLQNVDNLDKTIFEGQQWQEEYPGLDIAKLCNTKKSQGTNCQIGKNIYQTIMRD